MTERTVSWELNSHSNPSSTGESSTEKQKQKNIGLVFRHFRRFQFWWPQNVSSNLFLFQTENGSSERSPGTTRTATAASASTSSSRWTSGAGPGIPEIPVLRPGWTVKRASANGPGWLSTSTTATGTGTWPRRSSEGLQRRWLRPRYLPRKLSFSSSYLGT